MSWLTALLINTVLIAAAQRAPLLTAAGWVHAGALGTILWGAMGWQAWLAVVAYLGFGSLVTKIGWNNKQRRGLSEARGGRRGPENVWGSAAVGAILALLIGSGVPFRALAEIGFAASFAAKLADTFGSEVGKRWGQTTVLITSFRRVEPGTEGAISLEGTLASAIGSVLMTAVMVMLNLVPLGFAALVVSVVGLLATLVESVIGAVAQDRVSWLSNELVNALQTLIAAMLAMVVSRMLNLA
ncbi:MAG: TIGR00297 family protein [Synechococcus sp. MED850]|nr:TIGR00297 family protein [Synechococcus sp. MED850]OUW98373.1 MAG: TIGR00297 family protein [Cyanobacteria bacterium TMED229]